MKTTMKLDFTPYFSMLNQSYVTELGKVAKIVGLTVESVGPPCKLNDLCRINSKDGSQHVMAEVVGFRDNRVLLMPFDSVEGIGPGALVENTKEPLKVMVGEELLGRSLDGFPGVPGPSLRLQAPVLLAERQVEVLLHHYQCECAELEPPHPVRGIELESEIELEYMIK